MGRACLFLGQLLWPVGDATFRLARSGSHAHCKVGVRGAVSSSLPRPLGCIKATSERFTHHTRYQHCSRRLSCTHSFNSHNSDQFYRQKN